MLSIKHMKYTYTFFSFVFAYLLYYDYKWSKTHQLMPVPNVYISWLATINLLLQWFYHTTAAILMPSPHQSRTFALKLHTVTAPIVFPVSFVAVVIIWAHYLTEPGTLASVWERLLFSMTWCHVAVIPLFAMKVDIFMWQHLYPPNIPNPDLPTIFWQQFYHLLPMRYQANIGPALTSVIEIAVYYQFLVALNVWPGTNRIFIVVLCIRVFLYVRPVYRKLLKRLFY